MATRTVKFVANSSYQAAAIGPLELTMNPVGGFSHIVISNTAPTDDSAAFILKPVAGENFLALSLDAGDTLYVRSNRDAATISWIQTDPPV